MEDNVPDVFGADSGAVGARRIAWISAGTMRCGRFDQIDDLVAYGTEPLAVARGPG